MTKESSTAGSHLSVAMTTAETYEVQSTTGGYTMTSSRPREGDFYFQCAVLVIGVVGTAANALVIYAMIASKHHKKHVLIFNQNVFDLCSCLLLVIVYTLKLCNVYLTGTFGHWLCVLSEVSIWCPINGSIINLMSITVERYLRVVHYIRSKKLLRNWVIYSALAFAWISSVVYFMAMVFSVTAAVIDGACYARLIWKSRLGAVVYGMW